MSPRVLPIYGGQTGRAWDKPEARYHGAETVLDRENKTDHNATLITQDAERRRSSEIDGDGDVRAMQMRREI